MLSFFHFKNSSVTIGINFLLTSTSAIISSNTINNINTYQLHFHRHQQLFVNDHQMLLDFLIS